MVTTSSDGKDQNRAEAQSANRNRGNCLWKPHCGRLVGNAQIERNLSRNKARRPAGANTCQGERLMDVEVIGIRQLERGRKNHPELQNRRDSQEPSQAS